MPGFLSAYDGTERVPLGNGYWADVKRFISAKEMGAVEAAMGGKQRMDIGTGAKYVQLDSRAGRTELVVASLVAWNIDDEDGTVWPLDPGKAPYPPGCQRRQSVDRLPAPVFDQIWKACDESNDPDGPEGQRRFPEPADGGDQDGDAGTAGPAGVPA